MKNYQKAVVLSVAFYKEIKYNIGILKKMDEVGDVHGRCFIGGIRTKIRRGEG